MITTDDLFGPSTTLVDLLGTSGTVAALSPYLSTCVLILHFRGHCARHSHLIFAPQ